PSAINASSRGCREFAIDRPDLALFVVDTALRLSDKVVPMLTEELARRSETVPALCRVERELWALGRHLYVVNSRARSDDEHRVCHRGRSAGTASREGDRRGR